MCECENITEKLQTSNTVHKCKAPECRIYKNLFYSLEMKCKLSSTRMPLGSYSVRDMDSDDLAKTYRPQRGYFYKKSQKIRIQ